MIMGNLLCPLHSGSYDHAEFVASAVQCHVIMGNVLPLLHHAM